MRTSFPRECKRSSTRLSVHIVFISRYGVVIGARISLILLRRCLCSIIILCIFRWSMTAPLNILSATEGGD